MNINDAKKIMLDKVNLEIEAVELGEEIREKEKLIKRLDLDVKEAEYSYNELENSGMKQFFLGLMGKKEERLREAQNEVRRTRGELSTAEFELASLKSRAEEIEHTTKEIDSVCNDCLDIIAETDGEAMKIQIQAIREIPKRYEEIRSRLAELNQLIKTAYDWYAIRAIRDTRPSAVQGTFINKDYEMRKQSERIKDTINEIICLLNTYNQFATAEIQVEFHEKWMDDEKYWEQQAMAHDTMERIKKVEDWVYRLDSCWKGMGKQQKEAMQKLQEEVFAYLND